MNNNNTLTEQDIAYIVQILATRPLGEAMPLYLKLTGQAVAPVAPVAPPPPAP